MAQLPSASVGLDDQAGAFANADGLCAIVACVAQNADVTPRVFVSTKSILDQHKYSRGADYSAMHFEEPGKPVLFVGIPIVTAGTKGSQDTTGVTGTSAITVSAGADGILEGVDGVVTVTRGGTVGTDQLVVDLSCDGGRSKKSVRVGTASSYEIPHLGIVLNFGAGTLVAEDVFRFRTAPPKGDQAGLLAAREALAEQLKVVRTWLVADDVADSDAATDVLTQAKAYETVNKRFVRARVSVADRSGAARPDSAPALAAKARVKMTGTPSLTFAEVGATGDTITRDVGSWIADGLAVGMTARVTLSASNNVTGVISALSATVLTFGTTDLTPEVTAAAKVEAAPTLTFAEVGATGDTVVRSHGSWLEDGFRVGDTAKFKGTALNNVTGPIAALTATTLTFGTTDLAAEVIAMDVVTVEKVETMSAWMAAQDAEFAGIDDEPRIDIAIGCARKASPITGWKLRRPSAWALSLREYGHDVHIDTYRKADGPLDGWDMEDENGNVVEFDERTDGGALAGRFSCLRTWSNGPSGAFGALSLTRALESSLLSRSHNMDVANIGCSVVQAETENAIGAVLVLTKDGKGTPESLSLIEGRVNSALQTALLQDHGEGPRASIAVWGCDRNTLLNVPGAKLKGKMKLEVNGTLEDIDTSVVVQ